MRELDADAAYWAKWKFARLAIPMQERARDLGYALLVHGSLRRDIDMVAIPWTENAACMEDLIRALEKMIRALDVSPLEELRETEGPTEKPHGRRAWTIHVQGTYFDISVMPTRAAA